MKQATNILRGRPWLLLLMLFAWLLPQQAAAESSTYVDLKENYQIGLSGENTIYIQVPVYDMTSVDTWITNGYLKVKWDGQQEITLLNWYHPGGDIAGDATSCSTYFYTQADGYMDVTLGESRDFIRLDKSSAKTANVPVYDENYYHVKITWVLPYAALGKKLQFTWDVTRDNPGNATRAKEKVSLPTPNDIQVPSAGNVAKPIVTPAMLATQKKGKIEIPWFLAADKITEIHYEYLDAYNNLVTVPMDTLQKTGVIELSAIEPHKNFRIVSSYKVRGATSGSGSATYIDIDNVSSTPETLDLIHGPIGLTARPLADNRGKVEIKWGVANVASNDIAMTDFFEIQRSLTGREEDFETIGQELFAQSAQKTAYTFVDSTLVQAIEAGQLKDGGTLDSLTYRVRRTLSQIWGWDKENNCASSASCVVDDLHLLRIANVTAKWESERAYTVRVAWDYANEPTGVWDNRANMLLRVIMKNRDGGVIDTVKYVLTPQERAQRYKVVNVSRSCVNYDIQLDVDRNESPLNYKDQITQHFFPIRTADDWVAFREKVGAAQGKYDVNARLYADIDGGNVSISWGEDIAYRGVFDGNGHTLTVNFNGGVFNGRFMAPFRYVGNATFRNLHVKGTVQTNERNIAGLVASTLDSCTVVIENCHSSVTINSSYNGATNNGGFVSSLNKGTNVLIRNSKFDGKIEGANSSANGGFIGWMTASSSATIDNCVFAPENIQTKSDNNYTWACRADEATLTIVNSHATEKYTQYDDQGRFVIRSAADWSAFMTAVENAKNKKDINAVLYNDITVSDYVGGGEAAYYRGTFEGNGYTITFNKSGWTEKMIAPFRYVGQATFKNLHTAGTISSSNMYAAGLVAWVMQGTNVVIENCRSSVALNSTGSGDMTNAGFVGRVSGGKVTIRNSKFDGSFAGANSYGHGGFVAWVAANSSATIDHCLFAPTALNTKFDACRTWARGEGSISTTYCAATKEYSVFLIGSTADWNTFKDMVSNANGQYWVDAALTADITIDNTVGWDENKPFRGTFDGNGHTLNLNITGTVHNVDHCAPFRFARDFTIKNLHVTGKIDGGQHSAALVGKSLVSNSANRNHIENCRVSAEVNSSGWIGGGIVGYGNYTDIKNCLFDGTINCNQNKAGTGIQWWIGVFQGFIDGDVVCSVQNSLEKGTYKDGTEHKAMNLRSWAGWGNGYNEWTYNNWSYSSLEGGYSVGTMSVDDLVSRLGSSNWENSSGTAVPKLTGSYSSDGWHAGTISTDAQISFLGDTYWEVKDGVVVPKNTSVIVIDSRTTAEIIAEVKSYLPIGWKVDATTFAPETQTITESNVPAGTTKIENQFYHTNNGKIDEELIAETRQSSVLLSWNTDGSPIDYFVVLRREAGQGDDAWQEIAKDLTQMSYEDTSVSPIKKYEYKVRAVNDCEGITYSETQVKQGQSKDTGRLEGYVRFSDGTGVPGIKVNITGGSVSTSATTDESGHFVCDGLSYQNQQSVAYDVLPEGYAVEGGAFRVTFNDKTNDEKTREFIITNSNRFSGYVMYEGTSIPVKGARFKVNDYDLRNVRGEYVETEYDGSFSFRVLPTTNRIQVVMDGHTFANDGWYKSKDGHQFTADVASTYFYDTKKVKLTGRVVGGNEQGKLPLDNNLSRNNLGDNLKMVLTLEGDNTSWLVYDNQNPNRTEREEVIQHPGGNGHKTKVKTERKRMEVTPDSLTGEYVLMLPPVRWKVQQVYCEGYPTLFQDDQVSEVIDLTDCLTVTDSTFTGDYKNVEGKTVSNPKQSYNAVYNRIYHSPVEIHYAQLGFDDFTYFGDKSYTASDLAGNRAVVPLAYKGADGQAAYTFGHPVFSLERKYRIRLVLAERYAYNNSKTSERVDYVTVGGGTATMQNGLQAGSGRVVQQLDENGQTIFDLRADQTCQLLSGEDALKTVTFTVEQDGTYYQAQPLQAYVLNMFPLSSGVDVQNEGVPILLDILRDPPGSNSSTTLSKGSSLNYAYTMNMTTAAGLKYSSTTAETSLDYSGTVAAPAGVGSHDGDISVSENGDVTSAEFVFNMAGDKAYSYTMDVNHNISTSSDPTMVGADADLYIGVNHNVQVLPMSTIRAIPDAMFQKLRAQLGAGSPYASNSVLSQFVQYGNLVHIAEGVDGEGKKYHLVRDLSVGYGPDIVSEFIYSQRQIETQIIPDKAKEILGLMFTGTKDEAKKLANTTLKPVYLSLRDATDPLFGVTNTVFNTTIEQANDTTNYLVVLPDNKKPEDYTEEVMEKSMLLYMWTQFISQNEFEKLTTMGFVTNYDIAGAQSVTRSETFSTNFTNSSMLHFPFMKEPDFFSDEEIDPSAAFTEQLVNAILKAIETQKEEDPAADTDPEKKKEEETGSKAEIEFFGKKFKWKVSPVLASQVRETHTMGKAYSRTESFTIAPDPLSHLNVDVYTVDLPENKADTLDLNDLYTKDGELKDSVKTALSFFEQELTQAIASPRGFVFRTRGGATANPWEDERKTHFYSSGLVLDERTLKINNPTIRMDKQSVSGVSVSDAARFKVYLANESEKPEATGGAGIFNLFVYDRSNPNGAKISIDGQALTANGTNITLIPGVITEKTIEVRAGVGFDYEGLTLGIMSPSDPEGTLAMTSFDVHYLREAGAVNISSPGDKWVINTNSQEDAKRGWYIPVTINGFDRHQHNFDHIEFQYKESQRGDDSWVNLCSYYADSTLMANANGVREMIPENGNIVTQFYGEGVVIEKAYDMRAVLFCRNGNSYLTSPSKIISGIKDTRRPQLFGTPEPKSGVLNLNDDVVFNFSEDIEYNYLSAITNFEVKGEVNNNNLTETVSLQFSGQASMESEAKRNFSGKDLTIDMVIKPTDNSREMPLFSHGTNGQNLQLLLTADRKLKTVINGQSYTSDAAIDKDVFTHVAFSINQTDSLLTFFKDGVSIGQQKMTGLYNGTGTLIFGRTNEQDRTQSQYYEGRMMEARLWYTAMDPVQVGTYAKKRLSGYEKSLVDYYPMKEGSGNVATDLTQGANAKLTGTSWAIPRGMSLKLDKTDNGMQLTNEALNRTSEQDYTLMFWFKTDADGRGTLLSNGSGAREDSGAEDQFSIGFDGDKLSYRTHGFTVDIDGNWSDNEWHHYAMTVNRARNMVNIYMDKELRTTFEADSLGGISGGTPMIGGGTTAMTGYVDELCMFEQALPQQLISTYATESPNGDERGLMTYLSFDRQERQKDNDIMMVPYAYSKKIEIDADGNQRMELDPETKQPTGNPVRHYLFVDSEEKVLAHIDANTAAPVLPYEEVTNLKFGFIGKDNQLLVDIDESAAKLNRRNIYVTVRDVEDKNGNTLASPQTASFLVMTSSLEWMVNRITHTIPYGTGEDAGQEFSLPFYNNGARNHTYKIENCPKWLRLNKYGDVVAPQTLDTVSGTVSKDLNIGTYNEIIYLTDEEGISEPLYLTLTVEGEKPTWAETVDKDLLQHSMSISGEVFLYGDLDTDVRDIVGVFDNQNVCHGFANITHSAQTSETGLFLTVYDNQASGRQLYFRLWQYNTGRELVLTPSQNIKFERSAVLGMDKPIRFDAGEGFVQNFNLKKGWNWVSFNVKSEQLDNVNTLLSTMPWSEGDILTDLGSDTTLVYKNSQWMSTDSTKNMKISPLKSYAIKVQKDCTFPIAGTVISDMAQRTITLKPGWNGIGYTPVKSVALERALSDYYDYAETGDVIKSHTEFAYFTKTGSTGQWRGNLQYMKPGEGYLMLRKGQTEAKFTYPFFEMGSSEDWSTSTNRSAVAESPNTMTVSAHVEGVEIEEGDVLLAYANGQIVGEHVMSSDASAPAYLSIAGNTQKGIWFAIERDGEIKAATNEIMTFKKNAVIGSPDAPALIIFGRDMENGKWYTVSGVELPQKPTQKGVYIYNGKKVVIK